MENNSKIRALVRKFTTLGCFVPCIAGIGLLLVGQGAACSLDAHSEPTLAKGRMAVRLHSAKQRYRKGEPLELWVSMLNTGDSRFLLSIYGFYRFEVKDSRGRKVRYPGHDIIGEPPVPTSREDFVLLYPGDFFGFVSREIRLMSPGTYYIRVGIARTDFSDELGFQMWHGELWSNRLKVTVR